MKLITLGLNFPTYDYYAIKKIDLSMRIRHTTRCGLRGVLPLPELRLDGDDDELVVICISGLKYADVLTIFFMVYLT